MRIGYVTARLLLLELINMHIQGMNLHNCGVSQAMVSQLLKTWDTNGFESHLENVAVFYGRPCDWIVEAAEKYLRSFNSVLLVSRYAPTAATFLSVA